MPRVLQELTLAQLAAVIDELRVRSSSWKRLMAFNEGGSRRPLFCLNGFSADLEAYVQVGSLVDASVPVYGLASPDGIDDRGAVAEVRMRAYEQEIRSLQPNGPYRLCGFHFGGSEAFELACRLEQAGEEVLLILLDVYPPPSWLERSSWMPRMLQKLRSGESNPPAAQRLRGRVVLFETALDQAALQPQPDGRSRWERYVKGRFDIIQLHSERALLLKQPAVGTLVRYINQILCS